MAVQAESFNAHAQLQTDVWMGEKHSTASVQALPPSGAIELLASLPKSLLTGGEEQESDIKQDRPCHERVFWLFEPSPSIMPCKQRKSTAFL